MPTGWQRILQSKMGRRAQGPPRRTPYLHHSTLAVTEQTAAACREFYSELIGLHEVRSPVDKSVWFEEGVHLYWGTTKLTGSAIIPAEHVAICLGSRYEEVVEACKRWKLFLQEGTQYWGSPRCYVRDPCANRVELMKEPPS